MKKLIAVLIVISTLSLTLVSCGSFNLPDFLGGDPSDSATPDNAEELFVLIDDAMQGVSSYKTENDINMTLYVSNTSVKSDASGDETVILDGDGGYYYFRKDKISVTSPGQQESSTTSIVAFNEGNIFLSDKSAHPKNERQLRSKMTEEEFKEYLEKDSPDLTVLFEHCKKQELTRDDDGSVFLKAYQCSEEGINTFTELLDIDPALFGVNITDLEISVSTDKDFRMKRLYISLSFADSQDPVIAPVFNISSKYLGFNEAKKSLAQLDPKDYTEVESVTLLDDMQKYFDALSDRKSGSFERNFKTVVTLAGQQSSYQEHSKVSYDGSGPDIDYTFTVETTVNNQTVKDRYYQGELVRTIPGASAESSSMTEAQAKEYIASLKDPMCFDKSFVTDIKKKSEGVYTVSGYVSNPDVYEQALNEAGIDFYEATYTATVTVKNGEISEISCEIEAKGTYTTGNMSFSTGVDYTYLLTFNK